jgi:hypothetical protein
MAYTCKICDKIFDKSFFLERHNKRKFPCKPLAGKEAVRSRVFTVKLGVKRKT